MGAQTILFPELNAARYGDGRRHQNLILPELLRKKSLLVEFKDAGYNQAYEIIKKWVKLEEEGILQTKKETTLEVDFLAEVFGVALGYKAISDTAPIWNYEPKYSTVSGIADAALGFFAKSSTNPPTAVIELKGPKTNVDRDRFSGRTPVQQCWDYLNDLPQTPWGIVSNFVSFRLYHRDHTTRIYQHFTLNDLQREEVFDQFYCLFHWRGLIGKKQGSETYASELLRESGERQQEVGDKLYISYDSSRSDLIQHLTETPHHKELDRAIRITQKLFDRIIFIAFCEDRNLLPSRTINRAYTALPAFSQVTNPQWQNFKNLFRSVDKGNSIAEINAFNGGLFCEDPEVDNLELDDHWTNFFHEIGEYDFRDEVSVEVLGHLFERSINDIEQVRLSGIFQSAQVVSQPKMKKSAERKRGGIYYTPPEFTGFIVENVLGSTVDERFKLLAKKLKLSDSDLTSDVLRDDVAEYYRQSLALLRRLKVVDPACGSGAFLIKAYDYLEGKYIEVLDHLLYHTGDEDRSILEQIPHFLLHDNLFGVDLSPEAVEITQLSFWIRSAEPHKSLADLSQNIRCLNSLVTDPDVDSKAMKWEEEFADIFEREEGGFDCVIGNPPWERLKLQEREFFDASSPDIASAVSAATRKQLIQKLKQDNPALYDRYESAKKQAETILNHVRKNSQFPLTGKGDINTYALFAELGSSIVSPKGRVGLLVPSGISTDLTTSKFFNKLVEEKRIAGIFDFENRKKIFADVDGRFKFTIFLITGKGNPNDSFELSFFLHEMKELKQASRRIRLKPSDFALVNPNTKTCPVFRSQQDADITRQVYRNVPVLLNKTTDSNPWGIKFFTMFHQTNDASLFEETNNVIKKGYKYDNKTNAYKKKGDVLLPLIEAKMLQLYDHRAASVDVKDENWIRQGQTIASSNVQHQNEEYYPTPRWWVQDTSVYNHISSDISAIIAYKDITSPTNTRTMICSFIPVAGVLNSAPIVLSDKHEIYQCCLLANLNSFVLDYIARQKIGGLHLNFYLVKQFPVLNSDYYDKPCPWDNNIRLKEWLSDRVLKLTCTSNDMLPLAVACGIAEGVHRWDPQDRAVLMAELDAAFFILYQIKRDDVEYILSTFSGVDETESTLFGMRSTKQLILESYDSLFSQAQ